MHLHTESFIKLVNHLYDLEKKLIQKSDTQTYLRHIQRMKDSLVEMGITYHDPYGEPYSETRTDCEATIAGEGHQQLFIAETIKPIIRFQDGETGLIIQKGLVIAASK